MRDPETRMGGSYDQTGGGAAPRGEPGVPQRAVAFAQSWVQWAGAATSGALVLGVVVWGYQLAVRDVSGVPVIRALEGPARMAPENPGGDQAAHVGLAVNEVAGSGVAAPGPQRVVLAPAATELSPDDAPMAALRPLPEGPQAQEPPDAEASPVATPVPDLSADPEATPEGTAEGTAQNTDPAAETAETASEEAIPADVPGVARSPRPQPRPGRDLEAEAAALAVARALGGEPSEVVELDPADLPAGTRVVQLGAFDSPDLARVEWDKVAARFEALMAGKKRIVQEAVSGGRSFWRLRVEGFADVEATRQFCAALVAEGANCIPTVVK